MSIFGCPSRNVEKRRQRMAAARSMGRHTKAEWAALKDYCEFRCVRCGFRRADDYVEKDHIVPVYRGGSDGIDNIQPLCAWCNTGKGPEQIDYRPGGWREFVAEACAQ